MNEDELLLFLQCCTFKYGKHYEWRGFAKQNIAEIAKNIVYCENEGLPVRIEVDKCLMK